MMCEFQQKSNEKYSPWSETSVDRHGTTIAAAVTIMTKHLNAIHITFSIIKSYTCEHTLLFSFLFLTLSNRTFLEIMADKTETLTK